LVIGLMLPLSACARFEALSVNCSNTQGQAVARFPPQSPTTQFRFELLEGFAGEQNDAFNPADDNQDFWVWGGAAGNVNDGDTLSARWNALPVEFINPDQTTVHCNFCGSCAVHLTDGNLFEIVQQTGFTNAPNSLRTILVTHGCQSHSALDSALHPNEDGTYQLRYRPISCDTANDLLAENKVFVVRNGESRLVTYSTAEITSQGKIRLNVPFEDRFSSRLRVSRVQVVVGSCSGNIDPVTGKCRILNGRIKKLLSVQPDNTGRGQSNNVISADPNLPDEIDFTMSPYTTTPTFLHSAPELASRLTWYIELAPSDPVIPGENYAVQFTLIPKP